MLQEAAAAEHAVDTVIVLDFGSQYSQLITRRVRELGVFGEMMAHDASWDDVSRLNPKAVILSGGPSSVYEDGAPQLPGWVLEQNLPVLGICYGMQLLAHALGGTVEPAGQREYGQALLNVEPTGDAAILFEGLPTALPRLALLFIARCRTCVPPPNSHCTSTCHACCDY